jgi:hypothetical protein
MPTPVAVALSSIVTVGGSDIQGAISAFWAIPMVGSILLLYATLRFGPRVWRTVVGLFGRR